MDLGWPFLTGAAAVANHRVDQNALNQEEDDHHRPQDDIEEV